MSCRASNISTVYLSAPAALFIYASTCTPSDPDLLKPKNPSTASACGRAASALIRSRRASHMALLLSTGVHWRPVAAGASVWGRAPRWNTKNRPHPSGGGDIISRPYALRAPKDTRIARPQRRVPPARIRGDSAVFLPKVHSQRITVGGRRR